MIKESLIFAYQKLRKLYFYHNILKENRQKKKNGYIATIPRKIGDKIVILANGPSQEVYWKNREKFEDYAVLCMNNFPASDAENFYQLKPEFYCAIDPDFFKPEKELKVSEEIIETVKKTKAIIAAIDWDMQFITWDQYEPFVKSKFIHGIYLNRSQCENLDMDKRFELYSQNKGSLPAYTVFIAALFFAITFGFKEIAVFGLDFDFFKGLEVDKNNDAYIVVNHYGNLVDKDALWPGTEKKRYAYELFERIVSASKACIELNEYAITKGARITNYSVNSYIEAFAKKEI